MPPKKGRGIVSSGNAGNSSKASKVAPSASHALDDRKPLFPVGSKYPMSLLSERCQKNGWEKPSVDTRKQPEGYSFSVTLARINKSTSQRETVRLEPHPPYTCPTAIEARHWGATYALYRFCNNIQLNMVLPPGPREYWNELALAHKDATVTPEHQKWMYDPDPFAARRAVDQRQEKAVKRREEAVAGGEDAKRSRKARTSDFSQAPEVKMATPLRELVESAIKTTMSQYPELSDADATPPVLSDVQSADLAKQLATLGFKPAQTRATLAALSDPSALTTSLLQNASTPLEAAVEHLVLHLPECDLPARFLPASNSSDPFVTAAHVGAGRAALHRRWMEERAVRAAGFPVHAVRTALADPRLDDRWALLIAMLGRRLIGLDPADALLPGEPRWHIVQDEVDALGASYDSEGVLTMPLFSAPITLHIHPDRVPELHAMYLTSPSVPSYIRLHLLARLLCGLRDEAPGDADGGLLMVAMRILEEAWAAVEADGPPDILETLQHFSDPPKEEEEDGEEDTQQQHVPRGGGRRRRGGEQRDRRSSAQVKEDFEAVRRQKAYASLLAAREKLPAYAAKDQFLEQLDKHRVVVVVGETGCGKTTQLPQFILDSQILSSRGSGTSILVTQPRRISAISVAARVHQERLDDGSVGYAIRGESSQTNKTKLLFCTTGVVLRRLGSGDTLGGVSHIVVDEVHERSVDGDFLLLELRELLRRHPSLKVVLMSATINHETFVKYFDNAPLLTIPGFTHPVEDIYLEDVMPRISYRPSMFAPGRKQKEDERQAQKLEFEAKGIDDDTISAIQRVVSADRIDYQLIAAVVGHITSSAKRRGGILIFLPGVQEIRQCIEALRSNFPGDQAVIYPLHANLSSQEQTSVFAKTDKWKVIAATNVAETSITIDDVIVVIDAGKVKETRFDPENGLSRLVETWVTRAAARQRRGRAGRTQPGTCCKLYTRKQEEKMAKFPIPEILRVPLESITLTVKVMRENEDVKLFLSRAIDPPKVSAMETAWSVLEELGAVDVEGRLTALGRHIAMLPVDLRLAKMLVLATIFQCVGPILTVVACLSAKPLFVNPMDKRDEANQARARFSVGGSDLLTDANAFDTCVRLRTEGKPQRAIKDFCDENFISPATVRDITSLRADFLSSLSDLGFIPLSSTPSSPYLNTNSDNTNLLKAVILGGLWPRVARVHLPRSAIKFDKVQGGAVQRENVAKEFRIYDIQSDERVYMHPGSLLFAANAWKTPFVAYFSKHQTSKVFIRDATEVPLYAMLLFGGPVSVNHVAGGVAIGSSNSFIELKAWPRIGILVNQLRRLLDAQLQRCIVEGTMLSAGQANHVLKAMLALLTGDGLTVEY